MPNTPINSKPCCWIKPNSFEVTPLQVPLSWSRLWCACPLPTRRTTDPSPLPYLSTFEGKLRDGSRVPGQRRELQQHWEHWGRPCCCTPRLQRHGGCSAAFPGLGALSRTRFLGDCNQPLHLMVSTLGLPSPRKNWLLRSVLTTSLSTVNCTWRQKSFCSSGLMDSLQTSNSTGQPGQECDCHNEQKASFQP